MNRQTHRLCFVCCNGQYLDPDQPRPLRATTEELCCRCGRWTRSGITVTGDPLDFRCRGIHQPISESMTEEVPHP